LLILPMTHSWDPPSVWKQELLPCPGRTLLYITCMVSELFLTLPPTSTSVRDVSDDWLNPPCDINFQSQSISEWLLVWSGSRRDLLQWEQQPLRCQLPAQVREKLSYQCSETVYMIGYLFGLVKYSWEGSTFTLLISHSCLELLLEVISYSSSFSVAECSVCEATFTLKMLSDWVCASNHRLTAYLLSKVVLVHVKMTQLLICNPYLFAGSTTKGKIRIGINGAFAQTLWMGYRNLQLH
jgi:hypothetical protein